MSKSANAGELRTPVYVKRIVRTRDEDGYPHEEMVNVFGESVTLRVKWVNVHGSDAYIAMQQQIREPATLTSRYSPRIKNDCLIFKGDDPQPFEIESIDNVEERNEWLEIKVKRREEAR
ncbi:MAG: head-tail adaptor protein [Clostridia bacterium]|nr:head-tail adaptor protein [Clostridia bacterium]